MLGEKTGAWTAVHSEDDKMFEPDTLSEFDAVVMVNTTGDIFVHANYLEILIRKKSH